jgi:hypothetical protein
MYFFLRQNLFEELNVLEIVGHTDVTGDFLWTAGSRFDRAVPKETLLLDPEYGTNMPDFFDTTVPVMSKRLIDALHEAGVDNFDIYPMLLKRTDTGEEFEGYSAVNFIGCVDAVDLAKSEYRLRRERPYFTGPITIDPARTQGLEAFRLLHGPGFVVLNERPAELLRARGFVAVMLQPTVEYDGD